MINTEQVFALLAQANPISDPTELATAQVALVPDLPEQRNAEMQTQDITMRDTPAGTPRRTRPFVIAATVVVLAIGGVAGLWWLITTIGSPVAAADAHPTITCDEVTCLYDGPNQIKAGTVEFTLVNETAATSLSVSGWLFDSQTALDEELSRDAVGEDRAITANTPRPDAQQWVLFMAAPGRSAVQPYPLYEGQFFAVDVVSADSDGLLDHLWRTATIEIVAP